LAESFAGAEQSSFGRIATAAEALRDFEERELVPVKQSENRPIVGVHFGHPGFDAGIFVFDDRLRFGDRLNRFAHRGLQAFPLEPPRLLNASIHGNPEEPGAEPAAPVKPTKVPVDQGEDLLDGVHRFIAIEQDAASDRVDAVVILGVEGLESVVVFTQNPIDEKKILIEAIGFYVLVQL